MTRILGRPQGYGPAVPLKLVIREDIPYRTAALGVSAGHYEAMWTNNRWESGGAELAVTMPRWDKEDSIPLATTHVFISRTDTGAMVAKYDYNPGEWVETAAGEFDLGKGSYSRAWVRSRQIEELTDGAHAATQQAAAAADSVTAATLDLQNEKGTLTAVIDQQVGRVDSGLADIAHTTEAIEAKTADLLGAAPLLPDAQAAAAARPDAQAAAAALPDARAAAALLPDMQSALIALGSISTTLSGLRVTAVEDGYLFEVDPAVTTPATVQAAPLGGLLYEVM